jgi:hypothetical protein
VTLARDATQLRLRWRPDRSGRSSPAVPIGIRGIARDYAQLASITAFDARHPDAPRAPRPLPPEPVNDRDQGAQRRDEKKHEQRSQPRPVLQYKNFHDLPLLPDPMAALYALAWIRPVNSMRSATKIV